MDPQVQALLQQLDQMLTQAGGALTSTNQDQFNEMIRQFNLNYTNAVAGQYGYNTGVGQPGPAYAPTLNAQQDIGAIGYIPGYSGYGAGQSLQNLTDQSNLASQQANATGIYSGALQSQYIPGTFVQMDPNSPQIAGQGYGQILGFVTPTGQIQNVTVAEAAHMGFTGQVSATVPYQQFMQLTGSGPQQLPQVTPGALAQYSNLNSQAINQALASAGATGMYTQPGQIYAPGTAIDGSTFQQLPAATQSAYLARFPGDPAAAMQQWVNDDNQTIRNYYQQQGKPVPGTQGTPQETLQAQQQFFNQALQQAGLTGYVQNPGAPGSPGSTSTGTETQQAQQQMFNQANQLGTEYGQYYSPMMPGATAQAGVNTPQVGQITEQGREFNVNTASDLAKLASSLTGPADYFKYLRALNGGNSILQNLYSGQAQAPGGQVGSTGGVQSLDNILGQFGLSSGQLTGGTLPSGTYNGANINVGNQSGGGTGGMQSFNLPAPNQIQPAAYNSMSPSAQQFVQGAYQSAGYNPQDLNWFMNAATPAQTNTSTGIQGGGTAGAASHFANPSSQSLFA